MQLSEINEVLKAIRCFDLDFDIQILEFSRTLIFYLFYISVFVYSAIYTLIYHGF